MLKYALFTKTVPIAQKLIQILFKYKERLYSVPSDLIGKSIIEVIEDNLNVYYNKKLITIHKISKNKINYNEDHHSELMELTFEK